MNLWREIDLAAFPLTTLKPQMPLYRIYPRRWPLSGISSAVSEPGIPGWFCGEGDHRFDFPVGDAGTCYLSTSELGAAIEVIGRSSGRFEIKERRLATLNVRDPLVVLDLTSYRNPTSGGLINSILCRQKLISGRPSYIVSQSFAHFVFGNNISGIKWLSWRDPEYRSENLAIFRSEAGADDGTFFDITCTADIKRTLIEKAI
ncbi:RES family NAD+ phosphorylase [Actinoallomurus bryophytorum]|uniref:RES family NAD+ phosphorylase n=1 Tax=Actinoallomurus bryophytorum TaxID=1490222 RepID=UPI00115365B1|nr:RES family NAD+ phosphorylase [Actinoallomurus bryophytorum]